MPQPDQIIYATQDIANMRHVNGDPNVLGTYGEPGWTCQDWIGGGFYVWSGGAWNQVSFASPSVPAPAHFWPLDAVNGPNDVAGTANLAEVYATGSVTYSSFGASFDGTDFLTAGATLIPYPSSYSITFWCSSNLIGTVLGVAVAAWSDSPSDLFASFIAADGTMQYYVKDTNDLIGASISSSFKAVAGQQFFVALTYDETTLAAGLSINGGPLLSVIMPDPRRNGSDSFAVGGTVNYPLSGTVGFVRLFNTVLTQGQIASLYNKGTPA